MPNPPGHFDPERLLRQAQQGEAGALGELLAHYRSYLALLAAHKIDRALQARLDDSDLVQETCFSAHRDFPHFRGATEREFMGWLREIMAHVAANQARDHHRQRRDVRLERQLRGMLDDSSIVLEQALADPHLSPSNGAIRGERVAQFANALYELPADYRAVLVQREIDGKSLSEIAADMGRSVNAVQKLWARALVQLRQHVKAALDYS